MSDASTSRPWYTRIGPGLITACVVIGPGSILTSSTVGANQGYSMLWVVLCSVIVMMVYMTMGARLGVVAKAAPCDLIREKAGAWLAMLVGICVFFISAAFQSGNNIGAAAAFEAYFQPTEGGGDAGQSAMFAKIAGAALVVIFNAVAISFLYVFRNLYQVLEKVMMTFVALMLISFAVNLVILQPNLGAMAKGFLPPSDLDGVFDIAVLGLIGTTFVITAAFYQAYLVRQKGWTKNELSNGLLDARVGSVIMALITVMLMSTAAAGLYTPGEKVVLKNVIQVAESLKPTFGESGKLIFCMGLFSAAYSSFLVNSMIGGFIAADGLGLGCKPSDPWPRIMTTAALLSGAIVALAVIVFDFDRTPTIVAAQAVTVVGAPLVAGVLFWLSSSRDVMGDDAGYDAWGIVGKCVAGVGLLLLLGMAWVTATDKIPNTVRKYMNTKPAAADTNSAEPVEDSTQPNPAE